MHHTLFISDLHLEADQPKTVETFLNFLKQQAINADALYILGDFFEVWIGDDDHNPFNETIKHALKELTDKGIPVYLMPGNRDFLMGEKFAKETNTELLADPTCINLYGQLILLMHGDSLCLADTKHQKFRKFSQKSIVQNLFLGLPLFIRKFLAQTIRNISKKHTRSTTSYKLDVTPEAVIKEMQQNKVKQLIHGHTHKPDIHTLQVNNQEAKRIVLGAWHDQGNALIYYSNGEMQLVSF